MAVIAPKTKMKHAASSGVLELTKSMKESSIKVLPECSKGASPKRKGGSSWLKSMLDWAGITPRFEH